MVRKQYMSDSGTNKEVNHQNHCSKVLNERSIFCSDKTLTKMHASQETDPDSDIVQIAKYRLYGDMLNLTMTSLKQEINNLSNDEEGLQTLLSFLQKDWNELSEKFPNLSRDEWDNANEILVYAIYACHRKLNKKAFTINKVNRIASITSGLGEALTHKVDVDAFKARVDKFFHWYDNYEYVEYVGPYFPMIQSSGMGKTRLLMELKKLQNEQDKPTYLCLIILCKESTYQDKEDNEEYYFDGFINAGCTQDGEYPKRSNIEFEL
jgi:hypothetical protein